MASVALPPSYDSIASGHTQSPREDEAVYINEPLPRYFPPILSFQTLSSLLLPLFFLPLCILLLFTLAPVEKDEMSAAGSFFKSIILPAFTALALYVAIQFLLLPLYRRHRARYSQYLPVHTQNPLSSLSESTSTLRQRILVYLLPSRWAEWRYAHRRNERVHNAEEDEEEEEEELGEDIDFDIERDLVADEERERRRRDGLSLSIDARESSSDRRLSRELEEGFADSSDDDDDDDNRVIPDRRRR